MEPTFRNMIPRTNKRKKPADAKTATKKPKKAEENRPQKTEVNTRFSKDFEHDIESVLNTQFGQGSSEEQLSSHQIQMRRLFVYLAICGLTTTEHGGMFGLPFRLHEDHDTRKKPKETKTHTTLVAAGDYIMFSMDVLAAIYTLVGNLGENDPGKPSEQEEEKFRHLTYHNPRADKKENDSLMCAFDFIHRGYKTMQSNNTTQIFNALGVTGKFAEQPRRLMGMTRERYLAVCKYAKECTPDNDVKLLSQIRLAHEHVNRSYNGNNDENGYVIGKPYKHAWIREHWEVTKRFHQDLSEIYGVRDGAEDTQFEIPPLCSYMVNTATLVLPAANHPIENEPEFKDDVARPDGFERLRAYDLSPHLVPLWMRDIYDEYRVKNGHPTVDWMEVDDFIDAYMAHR